MNALEENSLTIDQIALACEQHGIKTRVRAYRIVAIEAHTKDHENLTNYTLKQLKVWLGY